MEDNAITLLGACTTRRNYIDIIATLSPRKSAYEMFCSLLAIKRQTDLFIIIYYNNESLSIYTNYDGSEHNETKILQWILKLRPSSVP